MSDDTEFLYRVAYAESKGSKCEICKDQIKEGDLRIATKKQGSSCDGVWTGWYHCNCYLHNKNVISTADIANFDNIRWDDQEEIKAFIDVESIAPVRSITLLKDLETSKAMKIQNEEMWSTRDNLRTLNVEKLKLLLEENNQQIQENTNKNKLMDTLMDLMTFGTLNPCSECQGQLEYVSRRGYKCIGNFNGWARCETLLVEPSRSRFEVPQSLKQHYSFLKTYESHVKTRIINTKLPIKRELRQSEARKKMLTCKYDSVVEHAGLSKSAYVYKEGQNIYSVTLALTDVRSNHNEYYKMQILVDGKDVYILFRCWGRIGEPSNYHQKTDAHNLTECLKKFAEIYKEKTGNEWKERKLFVKHINKMYPINVNYSHKNWKKLHVSVRNLIKLIFCHDKTFSEEFNFEIDLSRMPLGKLSKKQIGMAREVLTELKVLFKKGEANGLKCIAASNKFYTMIPHHFGTSLPLILNTEEIIQTKFELLESLLKFESDYNMIKDPLASYYQRLRTVINVLDRNTEYFEYIEKYVTNTHTITHKKWNLEIDEVFVLRRLDENDQYKLRANVSNKKLLWHGSRTQKYHKILPKGLEIAPQQVGLTDAMFEKGIHFTDRVSKAAQYCHANKEHPIGLLLLCEVELGNMLKRCERFRAGPDSKLTLPTNCDSIKGLGQTKPDPNETLIIDGVKIPLGTGIPSKIKSELLYNEYVVYEQSQVHVRYLVKMKFKFR